MHGSHNKVTFFFNYSACFLIYKNVIKNKFSVDKALRFKTVIQWYLHLEIPIMKLILSTLIAERTY